MRQPNSFYEQYDAIMQKAYETSLTQRILTYSYRAIYAWCRRIALFKSPLSIGHSVMMGKVKSAYLNAKIYVRGWVEGSNIVSYAAAVSRGVLLQPAVRIGIVIAAALFANILVVKICSLTITLPGWILRFALFGVSLALVLCDSDWNAISGTSAMMRFTSRRTVLRHTTYEDR